MNYRRILGTVIVATVLAGSAATPAHANSLSSDVIGMFPQNIGEFAYADLKQARSLSWFAQLKQQMLPARFKQFEQFLAAAGIDPNSQVEEVAWATVGAPLPPAAQNAPPANGTNGAKQQTAPAPDSEQVLGVALGSFRPEIAEAYFTG
jgi:hypothetical protein